MAPPGCEKHGVKLGWSGGAIEAVSHAILSRQGQMATNRALTLDSEVAAELGAPREQAAGTLHITELWRPGARQLGLAR